MNADCKLALQGGRTIGFAQYGDLIGKPLFYFHGWPSTRLQAKNYDALGKKLHIRIIAPDRPGYGISDFQKDRTLLDWPDDVLTIADFLKIKKFAVMGVSGGGPYAAVCAYKISQRLSNVGIVVGLGPIVGPESLAGTMFMSRIGWANYARHPWLRTVSAMIQCGFAYDPLPMGFYRIIFGAKADKKMYESRGVRMATKRNFREAFRGGIKGPQLDLKLYTAPWGFDVSKIRTKVFLWYGSDDRNVSLNMGKYYAKHVKGSKLTVFPNEGHMVSITHAEEIISLLTRSV